MIRTFAFAIAFLAASIASAAEGLPGGHWGLADTGPGGAATADIDTAGNALKDTTAAVDIGADCTPSTVADAAGNTCIGGGSGFVSIEDEIFFENTVTLKGSMEVQDDMILSIGNSLDGRMVYNTTADPDSHYQTPGSDSDCIVLTEKGDYNKNHGADCTANGGATLVLQSDDHTTGAERMEFYHGGTNGVMSTDAGALQLDPATGGVRIGRIVAASPSEPATCDATAEGMMVYVNDSDDSAGAAICICATITDDSTYDWRDFGDVAGAACSFF